MNDPDPASERLLEVFTAMLADGTVQAVGHARDPDDPMAASDEAGGIVTGFTCYFQYLDADGDPSWSILYAPGQRTVATAGQVAHLHAIVDEQLRRTVYYSDDERD